MHWALLTRAVETETVCLLLSMRQDTVRKPTEGKGLVAGNALGIVIRGWGSWDCVLLLSMRQDTVKKPTEGKGLVAGNALGIVNRGWGSWDCVFTVMHETGHSKEAYRR